MATKALYTKLFSIKLFYGVSFVGLIILTLATPFYAQASFLSFLGLEASAQVTPVSVPNSQTVSLPEAQMGVVGLNSKDTNDVVVDNDALSADIGPLGTHADTLAADYTDTDGVVSVYVVKDGDTLPVIAKMYGVSVNTILWANDLSKGAKITPGTTLIILPVSGISYTIKKGDTLAGIAKKFKADADDVGKYNGLEADSKLSPGDTVIIPDGELGTPTTTIQKTLTKGITKSNSQLPLTAYGATRYLPGHDGPNLGSYFIRPTRGCIRTQGLHGADGVDIACGKGVDTPILAAASGTVIIAKSSGWNGGFGDYVVINHPNGTQTLYGHMSRVDVSAGESVAQGQTIGLMGATGRATGKHLHFEVHGAKNPLGDNPNYGL